MLSTPTPFVKGFNDYTPIDDIKTVTPSDSTDLPNGTCKALIFNGTGNITFDTPNGTTVTLTISASWFGVQYIRATRVRATGTTIGAGNILACY